jgi:hypothetical protein
MSLQKSFLNSKTFDAVCSAIGLVSFCALSFFVAVFVSTLTYFWITDRPTVIETAYSPDGKLKAVVFEEAKSSSTKHVSVLGSKASLEKNRSGNVFTESCDCVSAKWISNQRLVIYSDGNRVVDGKSINFIAFDRGIDIDFRELKDK